MLPTIRGVLKEKNYVIYWGFILWMWRISNTEIHKINVKDLTFFKPVNYFHKPEIPIYETGNLALKHVKTEWVLEWDGDILAYPNIYKLARRTLHVNPKKYYFFEYWIVSFHAKMKKFFSTVQPRLYSNSSDIKFIPYQPKTKKARYTSVRVGCIFWNERSYAEISPKE